MPKRASSGGPKGRGGPQPKKKRSQADGEEIARLEQRLAEGAPPRGVVPAQVNASAASAADAGPSGGYAEARRFEELPLSQYTLAGLRDAKFETLTAIQRAALPHALAGRDVLGAAKTGSGKTLAFLLPVLEALYRARWSRLDGLGALIISPTRELAMQIFGELRKVGGRHELSAGLLIGGHDVAEERDRIAGMNILVCTPGRLLQHMDETPSFDAAALRVLVLDEADRILDLGFAATVAGILEGLPHERQTLLFSATQTRRVADLARLSLEDPEYIAVHAQAEAPTPLKLHQVYVVCALQDKLNLLWAFLKTHTKAKTVVFLSTCKQVKFVFEAFRRLRPGVPLRCLHGGMKQPKRMAAFLEFCQARGGAALLATDVAARGLDFPALDWVVQGDCPEDISAYIHRVGRTARYLAGGRALLVVAPSEREGMLDALEAARVPLKPIRVNPHKAQPITPALAALLSKNPELKELAQKALRAYLRSVFLQPNRAVFDVTQLPVADFARSLGLPSVPQLRFLKRNAPNAACGQQAVPPSPQLQDRAAAQPAGLPKLSKNIGREEEAGCDPVDIGEDAAAERSGSGSGAGPRHKLAGRLAAEDDGDFMIIKRSNALDVEVQAQALPAQALQPGAALVRQKKKRKLRIDPGKPSGQRTVFDAAGDAQEPLAVFALGAGGDEGAGDADRDDARAGSSTTQRFAAAAAALRARDAADRVTYRAQRRERAAARKARARATTKAEAGPTRGTMPVLGTLAPSNSSSSSGAEAAETADLAESYAAGGAKRRMNGVVMAEAAHWGMARAGEALGRPLETMTVPEQEDLALRLLSQRRT